MEFTTTDIEKLAALSRVALTDEEKQLFATQIASILDYAKQVQEVDTQGVTASSHVDYDVRVFREDIAQSPDNVEKHTGQFPTRAGSLNQVKRILE